jgi:hypothetical protein
MKFSAERDLQQTAQCVCGSSYIGEAGRPVAMWLYEHRHNLKGALLEISKLAQHV